MSGELVVGIAPKAVDRRREILQQVRSSICEKDLAIFEASTHRLISEMSEQELTEKCAKLFRGVAMDVGYTIPDRETWAYQQTRLLDLLRRYYGHLALAEVRVAFEMATIGELNAYLPKDANGYPDNKHYGQFSAAFFGKILTAYQQRQQVAIASAERAMPKETLWSAERQTQAERDLRQRCREIFDNYRSTGELDLGIAGEIYVYEWLASRGLVPDVDGENVADQFMQNVISRADNVVYSAARRDAIQKAFDKIVSENINIEEIL